MHKAIYIMHNDDFFVEYSGSQKDRMDKYHLCNQKYDKIWFVHDTSIFGKIFLNVQSAQVVRAIWLLGDNAPVEVWQTDTKQR